MLGGAVGVGLQIVSVALGVGVVIAQSAVLFTVLKVAGALVLVWLGVQSIRHRNEFGEGELDPVTPRTRRCWSTTAPGAASGPIGAVPERCTAVPTRAASTRQPTRPQTEERAP